MNTNTQMGRRGFLKAIVYGAAAAVAGCTSMNYDFRKNGLITELDQMVAGVKAHEGELYYIGETNNKKRVQGVKVGNIKDTTISYTVIGNELFITPTYKESAKEGVQEVTLVVEYTDGSKDKITKSVNFTPEKKSEREWRLYAEDQEALTNLRQRVYLWARGPNKGQRFMPTEPRRAYIERLDFVRVGIEDLTKKGLSADANQDVQQALGDLGKALTGKATYCYRDKRGELYASRLRGVGETVDYIAQTLTDTITNTAQTGLQAVALDDKGAQNIAGVSSTLEGILQAVKDSTITGGAQVRTWMGAIDALTKKKLANLQDGQPLRVELGDKYYASVRKSGLRTTIDVGTALGFDALLTISIVNCAQGDGGGKGVIIEFPPASPFPGPGSGSGGP